MIAAANTALGMASPVSREQQLENALRFVVRAYRNYAANPSHERRILVESAVTVAERIVLAGGA